MILTDFGTTYCKFLDIEKTAEPIVIATKDLQKSLKGSRETPAEEFRIKGKVDIATGHNGQRFAKKYVNELIALARGGEVIIRDDEYVLLDCGSRDIKFICYGNGKVIDMGWNTECGASMGFTIELLERYYDLDYHNMPTPKRSFSITCGVLGMSHIFDAVISGIPVTEAVASFIKGIAINAYRFAGSPKKIYLSGGLCDNPVFVNSFPCEIIPLGRFVLLEGLKKYANEMKKEE